MSEIFSLPGEVLLFLTQGASRRDPYALYRRLQTEEPVHRTAFGTWLVTRYDDIIRLLGDDRFSIDATKSLQPWAIAQSDALNTYFLNMMSMRDAPDHDRLHRLVKGFFTTRVVRRAWPGIEAIVDEMLDAVVDAGRMDVIADLAYQLPVNLSCSMFGISKKDWSLVRRWTESLARQIMRFNQSDEELHRAEASTKEFASYINALCSERYANPIDDDVLSALAVAARDGNRLDETELVAFCMLLLISGRDTATNMIGNSVLTLLRHPDQFECLRADLSLIKSANEECLRFESPVRLAARTALEDVEVGGKVISKGEVALVLLAAANRDPERFVEPERFDIARANNCHIAFGHGIHFCLGHAFARAAGEIVLNRFLRRFTDIELLVNEADLHWSDSLAFRGVESLPISFHPT